MEHLQLSHRDASAVMAKDDIIHGYLKSYLSHNENYGKQILASDVDLNKYVYNFYIFL